MTMRYFFTFDKDLYLTGSMTISTEKIPDILSTSELIECSEQTYYEIKNLQRETDCKFKLLSIPNDLLTKDMLVQVTNNFSTEKIEDLKKVLWNQLQLLYSQKISDLTNNVSLEERSTYDLKRELVNKYRSNTLTDHEENSLIAEAVEQGKTLAELIEKIENKSNKYILKICRLAGIKSNFKINLNDMNTNQDCLTLFKTVSKTIEDL